MAAVIIGLTGGIASGKSTVGRVFAALGAEVVDADQLARDAVRPGEPAWRDVRAAFGEDVLTPGGEIDRAWLGERVFNDSEARRRLNQIIHPVVAQELQERIREIRARPPRADGRPHVLVAEVPLLIEEGLTGLVDEIVLVVAHQSVQVSRLIGDKGLTEAQALARVRAQLPVAEKRPYARWIVDGEADPAQTRQQVEEIWTAITQASK
jgi:dephospho-CoA kinase